MSRLRTLLLVLLAFGSAACSKPADQPAPTPAYPVIDVIALSEGDAHRFDVSARSTRPGWTTFRFANRSPFEHFALLSRIPDSLGAEAYRNQIALVAQNLLDQFVMSREPHFPEAGLEIAPWYADVVVMGGPGFASPGETFDTHVDLEPGVYVLECYVKTADGVFHHALGMLEELRVEGEPLTAEGPAADVRIVIGADGLEAPDTLAAGLHVVEVVFEAQQQYPNLTQNDVHIVRMAPDTDIVRVAEWLDAMRPDGMIAPGSPAHFVAGSHERIQGTSAFFTVALEPGEYAWIAEVPDPASRGMVRSLFVRD